MQSSYFVAVALFVLIAGNQAAVQIDKNIQHKVIERNIDLTTQLVKIQHKITLEHLQKKEFNGDAYTFVVPLAERKNLSHILVTDALKKELKSVEEETNEGVTFTVKLTSTTSTPVINIEAIFTKSLHPSPSQIAQSDRQLVEYYGNAYFYSPYKTILQKTTLQLATKSIESFTTLKAATQTDNKVTYGPYDNIEAYSKEPITVHYENNSPFLTITNLDRVIEISHWGNVAVEETIDIVHSGAALKGSFSRYDFQKDTRSSQPCVKSYKTLLPASATEVYYRDTNGNISTSAMRLNKDSVELDLRPRFPLFGGWRTQYTLGYNVPSYEYLYNNGDQYLLKMRVIDHIFDDQIVDKATIKIILPEGVTNIKLITPYSVQRLPDQVHYTYLDTIGRTVVVFTKSNMVESHITDFNLRYKFTKVLMIQEPLLIIGFLYVLFLIVIIWTRLDFSIYKEAVPHLHKD